MQNLSAPKLIIGLGNPGAKYNDTRHNLGADVARELEWVKVLIPDTGMNNSGIPVRDYIKNKNITPQDILIIHDDLETPLGEIKYVKSGSAKGHNGVRSIHDELGTSEIPRLKLGIGRPPESIAVNDFVLSKFTLKEKEIVENMKKEAHKLLRKVASTSPLATNAEET